MKVIRRNEHFIYGTVVDEYLCPPGCPECAKEATVFVRGSDGKLHLQRLSELTVTRVKLEAKFCKKCNRWDNHDETWNHGD